MTRNKDSCLIYKDYIRFGPHCIISACTKDQKLKFGIETNFYTHDEVIFRKSIKQQSLSTQIHIYRISNIFYFELQYQNWFSACPGCQLSNQPLHWFPVESAKSPLVFCIHCWLAAVHRGIDFLNLLNKCSKCKMFVNLSNLYFLKRNRIGLVTNKFFKQRREIPWLLCNAVVQLKFQVE